MNPSNKSQRRHQDILDKEMLAKDTKSTRRKAGGRFAVLNAFVDFSLASLPRSDIAVWMVLYRDTKDGTARTSQTDIARRAGIGRRTAVRAISRLEKRRLLVKVHQGGLNRGTSSYRVMPMEKKLFAGVKAMAS
jgi:DNA-binding MarR family transcriptional regulator